MVGFIILISILLEYFRNNANYKSIVSLGSEALPILVDRIDRSKENGLKEYILSIATEEISKVNLKKDRGEWSSAKGFTKVWKTHLRIFLPT
ncbi:MAG TPA: hypothetical protein VN456_17745 [Desulfosporosinus sp.]|nr:hypothetical protein [Desulfosporosinus sp.]